MPQTSNKNGSWQKTVSASHTIKLTGNFNIAPVKIVLLVRFFFASARRCWRAGFMKIAPAMILWPGQMIQTRTDELVVLSERDETFGTVRAFALEEDDVFVAERAQADEPRRAAITEFIADFFFVIIFEDDDGGFMFGH